MSVSVAITCKVEYQALILDQCRLTDAIQPAGVVPVVVSGGHHRRAGATVAAATADGYVLMAVLLLQDDDLAGGTAVAVDHGRLR